MEYHFDMSSPFVHLHVHSHYSLLQALPKIKLLVARTKELGMDALALTDIGAMYGAMEFYEEAKRQGVKPIIGLDAFVAQRTRFDRDRALDAKPDHLVLLAENKIGYLNLMRLSSLSWLEGFFDVPRLDKQALRDACAGLSHGLIAISGGPEGEISRLVRRGLIEEAGTALRAYEEIFGPGNFFLELADRPELPEEQAVNARLIEIGRRLHVPLVVTKESFYLHPDDREAWLILQCIKSGKHLAEFEETSVEFDASFFHPKEIVERFSDAPEAIQNTRAIADRCSLELDLGKWNFPLITIPSGKSADRWLRERAFTEIIPKAGAITEEMKTRLDYELSIIQQKGFAPYFLVVSDYIAWARKYGIVTTTRGSAAGSLVSFAVGISTINPLTYALPFERFLNPERPSAPDVDADFADNRREEMLTYVTEKYGKNNVAQICTFGTMLARGSVRDVGRALGIPYRECDAFAKMIPMGSQGFPMTLDRAMAENPELTALYNSQPTLRRLVDLAKQIEGLARHVSIHAAGVVISPSALTNFTPLQKDLKEGKTLTQYDMGAVESAGLLKMDFLGIRNLSILGDAIALANKLKGAGLILEEIPVDDAETFKLLAKGHTVGVFQMAGSGMTRYLMELQPSKIQDIMAMVALYRPGPMESIPEYIRRKNHPELIEYLDPRLANILDQSYGIITYQDDVMLIAIHLAGYSWLEADKLRKAMGKKIPAEMAAQKEKLIHGFMEKGGLTKTLAEKIWHLIEPFAAYGFNKAHAASYGMISYQTAYMKAHFPAIYMTTLMTNESGDLEKIAEAVEECGRLGIRVLPPDVNESLPTFTYRNNEEIRFGLLAIKNLGSDVIQAIVEERKARGPYQNTEDFATRVPYRALTKKSLEALIKAGALDRFGERGVMLSGVETILHFHRARMREQMERQATLFDHTSLLTRATLKLRPIQEASHLQKLAWEFETLGLYVSAHPSEELFALAPGVFTSCRKALSSREKTYHKICVTVTAVKTFVTKARGEVMAFVTVGDASGEAEMIVFSDRFAVYRELFLEGQLILCSVQVSTKKGETKLICGSAGEVTEKNIESLGRLLRGGGWVTDLQADSPVPAPSFLSREESISQTIEIILRGKPGPEMIADLRDVLLAHPGQRRVSFVVESAGGERRILTEYAVGEGGGVIQEIERVVGPGAVVVK
jgi:DNA polymerase-3 subunit alpha